MDASLFVIIGYLAAVTGVGVYLTRRTSGSADWAVAGGGMSMAMIAVGVAGTRIGGAGTYGVAGDVIGDGVWNMWWYAISTFLAMATVGIFFAVPFRRLRLQTVGEVFTIRYGTRRSQVLTSLCVQTEYLIVNIIEAYVIGTILTGLTGLDMFWTTLIAAVVLVSYTSLGGLWGTAFTNLIHCSVILVGLFAVGMMGIREQGGWDNVTTLINGHLAEVEAVSTSAWWSVAGAGWGAVFGMIFSVVIHTPAASVYTNYSTAAKSERILIPGFLSAGVIAGLMPILAGLIGILTVAKYGFNPGTRGYTNITKLATEIDPFIGGIAIAAVLAAVISSGGPILLSSATMFVRDWLPFTRDFSSAGKLKAYRITTAIYGFVAAIIAWRVSLMPNVSVLDMLLFGFAMVVPPAIAVGFLLYWRRTTERGAFWGMATGYGGGVIWFGLIKWAAAVEYTVTDESSAVQRLIHYCFVHTGEGIDPSYATTVVPLLAVPIISLLTRDETDGKDDFYRRAWTTPGEGTESALAD